MKEQKEERLPLSFLKAREEEIPPVACAYRREACEVASGSQALGRLLSVAHKHAPGRGKAAMRTT